MALGGVERRCLNTQTSQPPLLTGQRVFPQLLISGTTLTRNRTCNLALPATD